MQDANSIKTGQKRKPKRFSHTTGSSMNRNKNYSAMVVYASGPFL